jgi:hypothetical protein
LKASGRLPHVFLENSDPFLFQEQLWTAERTVAADSFRFAWAPGSLLFLITIKF